MDEFECVDNNIYVNQNVSVITVNDVDITNDYYDEDIQSQDILSNEDKVSKPSNNPNYTNARLLKKIKEKLSDQILEGRKERMQMLKTIIDKNTTVATEDPIDKLFRGMAGTIKTFPPIFQAKAKAKLFQVKSEI